MNVSLKKCVDCDRLFSGPDGVQQCPKCASDDRVVFKRVEEAVELDGLTTVAEIAASIGVDPATVKRVLAVLPLLAEAVENDDLCSRCEVRPARIGKEFCPLCMVGVDADLRDMVRSVDLTSARRGDRREARKRKLSVRQALNAKKRRAANFRINPLTPNVRGF